MNRILVVALALLAALPASARRRDDVGRSTRRPAAPAAKVDAPAAKADAAAAQDHPVLRVNGLDVGQRDVDQELRDGEESWTRLREMYPEEHLLEKGESKDEFLVLNGLLIPRIVRHLFRDQDADAHRRAEEAYERAKKGDSWNELVGEYSTEPGANESGDLGMVAFHNLVAPFNREMFDAPLGVVQKPVPTMFGWHVGKVLEVVPAHDVKRPDGTTGHVPELRHVQQILVLWDVGHYEDGRTSDLRVELLDITQHVAVEVLDPQYCDEFPHWCERKPIAEGEAATPSPKP